MADNKKKPSTNKTASDLKSQKVAAIEKSNMHSEQQSNSKCCCFDKAMFDKKMLLGCVLSAVISISTALVVVKLGTISHNGKFETVIENQATTSKEVRDLSESVSLVNEGVSSLKADLEAKKENSSYVYKKLASMQRDILLIKQELHIDSKLLTEEILNSLPSDKKSFIEAFESVVKDGEPFTDFIKSYADKVDFKKYQTSADLLKFEKLTIKSIEDLKSDFSAIGVSVFETKTSESFWEKQKRIIKEKISEAIKIKKTDKNAEIITDSLDDKSIFLNAGNSLYDGKLNEAVDVLKKIKLENESIKTLISNIESRIELEESFAKFKEEFVTAESVANDPQQTSSVNERKLEE